MDGRDPFGYPIVQYLWVIGIACVGGIVKHLNSVNKLQSGKFMVDIITSGFTGILTFWCCEASNIHGPVSALMIAIGGMMGNRAWKEIENFCRARIGLPIEIETESKAGKTPAEDKP